MEKKQEMEKDMETKGDIITNDMDDGTRVLKKKKPVLEFILYVMTGLMVAATIFMIYSSVAYLKNYYSQYGMSIKEGLRDAVQYVITNSASFIVFAVVFFVLARIIRRMDKTHPLYKKVALNRTVAQTTDDAIDERVEEISDKEEVSDEDDNKKVPSDDEVDPEEGTPAETGEDK